MFGNNRVVSVLAVACAAALMVVSTPTASEAQIAKGDAACASKAGKGAAKLAKTVIIGMAKCRYGDISGK